MRKIGLILVPVNDDVLVALERQAELTEAGVADLVSGGAGGPRHWQEVCPTTTS